MIKVNGSNSSNGFWPRVLAVMTGSVLGIIVMVGSIFVCCFLCGIALLSIIGRSDDQAVARKGGVDAFETTQAPVTIGPRNTPVVTLVPLRRETSTVTVTSTTEPTSTLEPTSTRTASGDPLGRYTARSWRPLIAQMYKGVRVYSGTGDEKLYNFKVVGGNEDCSRDFIPSGRGVLVEFPSGNVEWKDRDALISSGVLYVDADDPALDERDWEVLPGC